MTTSEGGTDICWGKKKKDNMKRVFRRKYDHTRGDVKKKSEQRARIGKVLVERKDGGTGESFKVVNRGKHSVRQRGKRHQTSQRGGEGLHGGTQYCDPRTATGPQ